MYLKRLVTVAAAAAFALGMAGGASAQSASAPAPDFAAQRGETPQIPEIPETAGQTGSASGNSLVIRPQNTGAARPSTEEIPGGKVYKPSREDASVDRNFNPGNLDNRLKNQNGPKPYIGISVKETTTCFLGKEEDGLEIVEVDPNSPAAVAGVHGPTGATMAGAAGALAGMLAGPLEPAVHHMLQKRGSLGEPGDIIIAVDGHRVRTEADLDSYMARLRPGDTMYITVLRPLPGGSHTTQHIAIKVGQVGEAYAAAAAPPVTSGPPPSTSPGEEAVR